MALIQRDSSAGIPMLNLMRPAKRRSGRWVTLLFLFSGLLWTSEPRPLWSADVPEHPQAYTAEKLVTALAKSLTSIDSLSCDFAEVNTRDNERQPGRRFKYAREGSKWHVTEFRREVKPGDWEESVRCFDEDRVYSYYIRHSPDGQIVMGTLEIHDYSGEPELVSPERLIGTALSNRLKPLPALLQSNAVEMRTNQGLEGTRDIHLLLRGITGDVVVDEHRFASDFDVIIDPEHGMLPSSIRVEFSAETKEFAKTHRHWFQQWRVLNFDEILDEKSQVKRWFPRRGVLEQGGVPQQADRGPLIELSLENARINPPLDQGLFNPKVHGGTTVFDLTTERR